jgi:hypothetical protein
MDKEDIIRMAREAGLAYGSDEKPLGSVTRFAALVAAAEREKVARWHIGSGYTTGHGDTIEDLLVELEWQVRESEREACCSGEVLNAANINGGDHPHQVIEKYQAAIRARGNI